MPLIRALHSTQHSRDLKWSFSAATFAIVITRAGSPGHLKRLELQILKHFFSQIVAKLPIAIAAEPFSQCWWICFYSNGTGMKLKLLLRLGS